MNVENTWIHIHVVVRRIINVKISDAFKETLFLTDGNRAHVLPIVNHFVFFQQSLAFSSC